jgi:glycosyltransferase involved in cell wall biosynthesis
MKQNSLTVNDREGKDSGDAVARRQRDSPVTRRIFYLVDSFNLGGTESQAVELALRMSARGHRVTLGCLKAEGPLRQRLEGSNVEVKEFLPKGGIDSAGGAFQLARLIWHLRKRGYVIVHTHDLWSNLLGVPAGRLAGVPVIISSRRDLGHLDWYQGKRRIWLKRIQNLSHCILTNATSIRDVLIAKDGFETEKLRVIHNGIDVEKFLRTGEKKTLLPRAGEGKLIVLVGNMHSEVKGHSWLIACAPAVVAEFPRTQFVLVGGGEQQERFENEVLALGMRDSFIFAGRRKDIAEILACCDIGILPSLAEGLPNALLEYMAAGLPAVVSNVGGNVELVKDGVTGLLVPPRDSAALSAAILKLLLDSDLASRIANQAREFVERNFSFECMVQQVEDLYEEMLRKNERVA